MKKQFLLLPLFGLLMVGCSNEDVITTDKNIDTDENGARSYLSITLRSANSIGTRADADGTYKDGTAEENNVTAVRFFFFDENGDPAAAKKKNGTGGYNSFIDWYLSTEDVKDPTPDNDKGITVEKVLNATLGINTPDEQANPAKVVAVLNPTPQILELETGENKLGPSLADLQGCVADFKTGLTKDNFVMSNSVYVDNNKSIVYATELTNDNFKNSIEEAENASVTIFVERVLARLDLSIALENSIVVDRDTLYKVWSGNIDDKSQDIYVKLLGWNITGTTEESRLIKDVSSDWKDEDIFGDTGILWNTNNYHRSFWALNHSELKAIPDGTDIIKIPGYQFGEFETDSKSGNYYPAKGNKIPTGTKPVTVYLQENANVYSDAKTVGGPAYPTKVIIAAQLVDKDGKECELAEWAYKKYTLGALKTKLANEVLNLYKKTTTNNETTYTKITPSDLDFKTAVDLREDTGDDEKYYVYAVLHEGVEGYTWTLGNDKNASELKNKEAVNAYIRDAVNHVMVWKQGYTYYYFDIRHLSTKDGTPGYYGVVRNHIYDSKVTSITGLGTPVYNPDEVIYPEKPDTDASIVSATVKILQWRVVGQDYKLEW